MSLKATLLVSVLGVMAASAPPANATVVYEVFNPAVTPTFVFFVYDSPGFITTDTVVPASSLARNNTTHPVTSIDFIMDFPAMPGLCGRPDYDRASSPGSDGTGQIPPARRPGTGRDLSVRVRKLRLS